MREAARIAHEFHIRFGDDHYSLTITFQLIEGGMDSKIIGESLFRASMVCMIFILRSPSRYTPADTGELDRMPTEALADADSQRSEKRGTSRDCTNGGKRCQPNETSSRSNLP